MWTSILGGIAVRDRDGYKEFLDRTFQEIDDLEAESNKHPILNGVRDYGLTMAEATRLYYKRGMTGRQFLDAIKAHKVR
jgi:hypothetical protein